MPASQNMNPGRSRAITLPVVQVWGNARPCPQNRKPQHGRKVSAGKILLKLLHPPQKLMMTDL